MSRGLCPAQVRSLPLWLSQILVLLAEGRVLLEASYGGLGDAPACSPHPWWLWQQVSIDILSGDERRIQKLWQW